MSRFLARVVGLRRRRGQTTAEYAIIVALVAISCIAVLLIFGDQIRNVFKASSEQMSGDDTATTQKVDVTDQATKGGMKDF